MGVLRMMYFPLAPTQERIDSLYKRDLYVKIAAAMGKPEQAEKLYQDAVNRYKDSFRWQAQYARSYKIPEFYRDYWFGVDGSTDCSILIENGIKVVAEHYVKLLRDTLENIALDEYVIFDHKEALKMSTVPVGRKERLLEEIKKCEENVKGAFDKYIRSEAIFTNPPHLRTTVFRIGAAQGTIFRNDRTDAESTFENNYNYLKRSTGTAYFGKKAVWERMSQIVGKEVTEKNYKDLWADYGFFYCRILNGEITDIKEI